MSHKLELFIPTYLCLEITLPLKRIIKISHDFSCYCKMGYRSVQERPSKLSVCHHCQVPYISGTVIRICITLKCVEILVVVFISSCRQELDHFQEEGEKYGNRSRVLVHTGCLLYTQSTKTINERMDMTRIP